MASETVTGARRDLGVQLARLREAAGYTQAALARQLGYSRSTVANAEVGQGAARHFWEKSDEVLGASGNLVTTFEQIELLHLRRKHQETSTTEVKRGSTEAAPMGAATPALTTFLRTTLEGHSSTERALGMVEDLEHRILYAHQERLQNLPVQLSLTLVGGYAGSGKSEFARFLSAVTGWTILDKDTLTRPLVEQLLISLGADPHDRQTALYQDHVRSHEYRCLLDQGMENLDCGVSAILTAPFLREITDVSWIGRAKNRCTAHTAAFSVVWVKCDSESMHDYLSFRGASRDAWKLAHWGEYLNTIDPDFEPKFPHYLVNNSLNAAVALAEQATQVAHRMTNAL